MKNNKVILKVYRKNTIKRIKEKITKAGLNNKYDALSFLNRRLISSILLFFLIMIISDKGYILAPILSIIFFIAYEKIFLDNKLNKRKKQLENDAINFFEVLTLIIEGGKNLKSALEMTCQNIDSELSREFKKSLDEISLGKSLVEALEDTKKRIPSDVINNTILNITESSIFGNSILESLYNQIDYLREQQVLDIKARISKMPIKISIVSVLIFLPLFLLIIMAPIVIQYLLR